MKLRGKDRIQTFSGNVRCLFGCPVCKSVSIIQEIGNIKRSLVEIFCTMIASPVQAAKNAVIMKDSN